MSRQGNRLHAIATLSNTYLGRVVTIGDLTGTLAGLIPIGDRVQAVLICGGARIYTDALAADTHVEVWQKGTTP
jgi:hypothetical protein